MSETWKGRFVEVNGVQLYVEEGGSGPPIVFLHGYSLDLTYWRPVAESLRATHRVVLYDSRGAGKSGGALPPYRFAQHAEDLDALLRALEIDRPLLCGHSMGGDIVLQYAVTYPRKPAALVVADAPGPYNLWVGRLGGAGLLLLFWLGARLRLARPQRLALPVCRYLFWSLPFCGRHPEAIAAWEAQFLSCSIDGLSSEIKALAGREKLTWRLAAVAAPALLLQGSLDAMVAERQMRRYHERMRGSRLTLIEGSGHMAPNEKPEEFARLVAAFSTGREEAAR